MFAILRILEYIKRIMSNYNFGKLKRVDLREIWSHEAKDFSVWVAEGGGLASLGEKIGIPHISLLGTEVQVGQFKADIYAQDMESGKNIVIENQLEKTDHDHLGKIVTYTAGLDDVTTIVWIFKDMKEEHKAAIDWLNQHTDEDISFYAVKIEVWRINDSDPAPEFQVICRPNELIRATKLGKTQNKQFHFWGDLKAYTIEKGSALFQDLPKARSYYNILLDGIPYDTAHISFNINTMKRILICQIYISDNKDLFKYLEDRKQKIEEEVGTPLKWKNENNKRSSNILQQKENFNLDNQENQTDDFDWIIERATVFHKVFSKYVQEFTKNEK